MVCVPGAADLHTVQCGGQNGRYVITATDDRVWIWTVGTLQMWKQLRVCSSGSHDSGVGPALTSAILWEDETCVIAGTAHGTVLVCALEEET